MSETLLARVEALEAAVAALTKPPSSEIGMRFSSTQMRLLDRLMDCAPNLVRAEELAGLLPRAMDPRSLIVHLSTVRRVLRPYGIKIINDHGMGYRMMESDAAKLRGLLEC